MGLSENAVTLKSTASSITSKPFNPPFSDIQIPFSIAEIPSFLWLNNNYLVNSQIWCCLPQNHHFSNRNHPWTTSETPWTTATTATSEEPRGGSSSTSGEAPKAPSHFREDPRPELMPCKIWWTNVNNVALLMMTTRTRRSRREEDDEDDDDDYYHNLNFDSQCYLLSN